MLHHHLIFPLLVLLSPTYAHSHRKTLGFGPTLPHAVFKRPSHTSLLPTSHEDPFALAKRTVSELMDSQLSQEITFVIRPDSYTDKNTGVSHIYVTQIVNGIQVADGLMNLNIKDGVVISYGNSFYDGPAPSPMTSPADELAHNRHSSCMELHQHIGDHYSQHPQQMLLSVRPEFPGSDTLYRLIDHNCAFFQAPYQFEHATAGPDPRRALLQFMIAATPDPAVAHDIVQRYDEHLAAMTSEIEHHLVGSHDVTVEKFGNVPDTVNPVPSKLAYVQVPTPDGTTKLQLVWKFEVEMKDNWYEAAVSFNPPHRIISVVDWASDSPLAPPEDPRVPGTYNVFPWGINDPSDGNRSIVKERIDTLASPVGWHSLPFTHDPQMQGVVRDPNDTVYRNTSTTWGNNVFAHENWEGRNEWLDNYRPDSGASMVFNYTYNPKFTNSSEDDMDEAKKYINTTITQLFYTANMVHDLYYRYGFDEVSGNFQQYNFGRGGKENDAVITNAQDGSGFNNANFMTPPDGQNGRCRMYLWNTASPYRDGDLEAGIVIHEFSHGLSTRLTGGPANSACLGWGESGGMGEGWGDFLATIIRSTSNYSDYPMGAWAANNEKGIRNYVYSVNETINPSTYQTLDKPGYWGVHAVGEVWAEMLWVVAQRLIGKHGFTDNLFPPPAGNEAESDFYAPRAPGQPLVPRHGNSLIIQLVLNAMKMQPCRPSFFDARDAVIQADEVLTGGSNFCDLWAGFASRGLGVDSKVVGRTPWGGGVRTDGFEVPYACEPPQKRS